MKTMAKKKRVLLKLSGEAFLGSQKFGIDPEFTNRVAKEIAELSKKYEIAVTIGGGNFFRGTTAEAHGMDRAAGDYAGMLATVINALVLQNAIVKEGVEARVMTALNMNEVAEPYIRQRALHHLERGYVVIFAAGTGNPFFTSDMAAALRALEVGASAVYKATKVDGVYTNDPVKHKSAKKYDEISYAEVLSKNLKFMDPSAVALLGEHKIPIILFSLKTPGNIERAFRGDRVGTVIK